MPRLSAADGCPVVPQPTKEQVQQEYERIWRQIGSRSIEELVDLPLMTEPELRGTMDVLNAVVAPALWTDENLFCLVILPDGKPQLEHGTATDRASPTSV